MRLSDKCRLDGCEQPHLRKAVHMVGTHKYYYCSDDHQVRDLTKQIESGKGVINGTRVK